MPSVPDLACPKCAGKLRFGSGQTGPIGTCYDCWGLWINTQQLKESRLEYPVGSGLYEATAKLRPSKATGTDLLCPSCPGEVLAQQIIKEVELEWCPICRGIYLDKGERERLLGLPMASHVRGSIVALPIAPASDSPSVGNAYAAGEVLELLAEILSDFIQ